ncbi:MAG: ROK family protein [Lactobacillus sp.]|nr:ROK family protein [Lactobacillus sp.]
MKQYLSIDIGGTNVKYAIMDRSGKIVTKDKIASPQELNEFLAAIDQIVSQYASEISGLAICAPGKVEHNVIHYGGALEFLDGIDFGKIYHDASFPIAVINDGKAAVLAESWIGSLQHCENCAAIVLGTLVGGGIIVNNHLLNGVHFQAGEISFMDFQTGDDRDRMSGFQASSVGMIKAVNRALGHQNLTDGLAAFEAINAGDKRVMPIFNAFCEKVASIILNIQTVVDLEKFAIGGGISAQAILVKSINQAYDRLVNDKMPMVGSTLTRPEIVDSKLKNDANLYGALYNLLLTVTETA